MDKTIQQRIIDYIQRFSESLNVIDVRIGLGYTCVRLDNGNIGLAWTANSYSGSCTHMEKAGTFAGQSARELLFMLYDNHGLLLGNKNPIERSVGLATANAVAAGLPRPESTNRDVLDIINVQASDHVVMVGFFGPLIPVLEKTGCRLDVLELRDDRPGTLSPEQGRGPLAACSVAIITGTSIVTGTLDNLLAGLGKPRAVVILGPSTFMRPEVYAGTPVTHLAGAWIRNPSAVERIVSQGGGTMILRQYMEFATICL